MLTILLSDALACGGLFCSTTPANPLPVVQNAERVAFAIDGGFVETHVQVFYEGPPDAFAWVVPVPGDVEVFASNEALFQVLDQQLSPVFSVNRAFSGNCGGGGLGCQAGAPVADFGLPVDTASFDDPVQVASAGQVGPYDYVVLTGASEQAIVGYLQDEGYDFDSSMGEALQPYLANDGYFLAVRLRKDRDTGDIAPLGFRYAGDQATLPIQLTRIAATPDMGIQVNVFGTTKAVSSNYLHVTLDESKVDWLNQGQNYFDLVARGVDEAGGHAVVTDYAGSTFALQDAVWNATREAWVPYLREADTPASFLDTLSQMNLPDNAALTYGFEGLVAYDPGVSLQPEDLEGVDLVTLTDQLDARVFENLRRIQHMLDLGFVTRMSTTLDPAEMTLDPIFVLNEAAPDVSQLHTVYQTIECRGDKRTTEWSLLDGRTYRTAPGPENPRTEAIALRIERWDATGAPDVVLDNSEAALDGAEGPVRRCGCEGTGMLPGGLLSLLTGLLIARRRR